MQRFSNTRRWAPSSLDYGRLGRRRRVLRHFRSAAACFLLMFLTLYFTGYLAYFINDPRDLSVPLDVKSTFGSTTDLDEPATQDDAGSDYGNMNKISIEVYQPEKNLQASPTWFSPHVDFERALSRVIEMMPGEMELRSLLHPIQGTGAEKLREIGLRAREYKKYLAVWEDLHFVEYSGKDTFLRTDMIQHIRRYFSRRPGQIPLSGLDKTIHAYEEYKSFISRFEQLMASWTTPYFTDHMGLHLSFKDAGRGIVVTAGTGHVPTVMTMIASFRDLGCTLPIEIMYLNDGDLDVDMQAQLESMEGVITRELAPMVNDAGWTLAGWALKPFAILFSSFREVIFIDADSLFFSSPEKLFSDEDYEKTGALFFKDRSLFPDSKKEWLKNVMPRPISPQVINNRFWKGDSAHMQESGVIVVDKFRHFVALLIVCRMNGPERNGDKDKGIVGVYDMVYGDKETFWIGWELVGDVEYAFHRGGIATMGTLESTDSEDYVKLESSTEDEKSKEDVKISIAPVTEDHDRDEESGDENRDENTEEEKQQRQARYLDNLTNEELDAFIAETSKDVPRMVEDEKVPESSEPSYTICSPQLVHLNADGTPLWFNGGLITNKFAEKRDITFGKFEQYIVEPEVPTSATWALKSNNRACLSAEANAMHSLSSQDKATLKTMIERAKAHLL